MMTLAHTRAGRQLFEQAARRLPAGRVACVALVFLVSSFGVRASAPAPAQSAPAAGQATARPMANLNQVMRAILFPNSNVIFNVQSEDPGAEKTAAQSNGPRGPSITAWGDSIYSRWEVVSYAAVALEESATLLKSAGRVCQNGKPVPVADADWDRYTTELGDAARAVYVAAQSKNRDVVIQLTDRLNDSCAACHDAYRRGPDAARCTPRP